MLIDFKKIENKKLAGFWRRLSAFFVDGIITYVIAGLIACLLFILGNLILDSIQEVNKSYGKYIFLISILASTIFYYWNRTYLQSKKGQSIGKKLLGLYILRDENILPGFKKLFFREIILGITSSLNFFFIVFRKDKKGIHDISANTKVFYINERKYNIKFYIALLATILYILTPIIIFIFIFGIAPEIDKREKIKEYNKYIMEQKQAKENREYLTRDYVDKINSRTNYPVILYENLIWFNTTVESDNYLDDSKEYNIVNYKYRFIDETKTKNELFDKYKYFDYYIIRNEFINKKICEHEDGKITFNDIKVRYEYYVGDKKVGDFYITKIDCFK